MQNNVFVGRLTKDIELRYAKDGMAICNLDLAINSVKDVLYITITYFGKTAENCNKYLKKGSLVGGSYTIKNNNYEKDNKKVYGYQFVGNSLTFLSTENKQVAKQEIKEEPKEERDYFKEFAEENSDLELPW